MRNEIKKNELTLKDLRILGRQGGATARLESGEELVLSSGFALPERSGYVGGELRPVQMTIEYAKIYSQIRTVKRGDILVARRIRRGTDTILQLTGKGYTRPSK